PHQSWPVPTVFPSRLEPPAAAVGPRERRNAPCAWDRLLPPLPEHRYRPCCKPLPTTRDSGPLGVPANEGVRPRRAVRALDPYSAEWSPFDWTPTAWYLFPPGARIGTT